jgi:hypothetical protein
LESAESLFDEIRQAGLLLTNDWTVRQSNALDQRTHHIYSCRTLRELESRATQLQLSVYERQYAIHRWRNFKRHDAWQSLLFEQVPAIRLVENPYSKKQDFLVSTPEEEIPFDLKVTRYPKSAQDNLSDSALAEWFYRNQSSEGRFHLANRFFVVGQPEEALYDILLARMTIREFVKNMRLFRHFISHPDGTKSRAVLLRQTSNPKN